MEDHVFSMVLVGTSFVAVAAAVAIAIVVESTGLGRRYMRRRARHRAQALERKMQSNLLSRSGSLAKG